MSPMSPVAVPAVPEKVGVTFGVALPSAGVVSVTAGPVASTIQPALAGDPRFPAASAAYTVNVCAALGRPE